MELTSPGITGHLWLEPEPLPSWFVGCALELLLFFWTACLGQTEPEGKASFEFVRAWALPLPARWARALHPALLMESWLPYL